MKLVGLVVALGALASAEVDACTAMIVGKGATGGVGPLTSHTNDCLNCDYRLSKVPAKKHMVGEKIPLYRYRAPYPRYVGSDRGDTYEEKYIDKSVYNWTATPAIGYVDQVEHTYAYVDAQYGIMNEHGLAMGESTCGAKIASLPVYLGGKAEIEVGGLSRLAMERCKTARCAIKLMGAVAEEKGYYGAEPQSPAPAKYLEAGETLTIIDNEEAWMFSILPDDTGTSAVWVAQRVPDDHVSVVANAFVIRKIDLSDPENFMASTNIFDVARRVGFFNDPDDANFDFAAVYAFPMSNKATYATRRVWRVLSTMAPSLNLPGETNTLGDDYPFSVKAEKVVTPQDIMALNRDHFEGTPYDTTKGPFGGAWGNPNRYDGGANPSIDDPITPAEASNPNGHVERVISMFRTTYSTVLQPRSALPKELAMFWIAMHAPHGAVYLPVYVEAKDIPPPLRDGDRYTFNQEIAFWANMAVSNYMERAFGPMVPDVKAKQKELEDKLFLTRESVEIGLVEALQNLPEGDDGSLASTVASVTLTSFANGAAEENVATWWKFFLFLIAKFHDGYRIDDFHAETMNPTKLFYPKWWLEQVGFWDPKKAYVPMSPKQDPWIMTPFGMNPGQVAPVLAASASYGPITIQSHYTFVSVMWFVCLTAACFTAVGVYLGKKRGRNAYEHLA